MASKSDNFVWSSYLFIWRPALFSEYRSTLCSLGSGAGKRVGGEDGVFCAALSGIHEPMAILVAVVEGKKQVRSRVLMLHRCDSESRLKFARHFTGESTYSLGM